MDASSKAKEFWPVCFSVNELHLRLGTKKEFQEKHPKGPDKTLQKML